MITAKKSNAGFILIALAAVCLLFGAIAGSDAMIVMGIFAVVLLIIGICLAVTSSKNYKKKSEWIARTNVDGTVDRINNSIANGTATSYKSLKLILTSHEVVSDSPSEPVIIKYEDIAKVYRSNINGDQYDYNTQHICLDLKTGQRISVAVVNRVRVPQEFGAAIGLIKSHINTEGGLQ